MHAEVFVNFVKGYFNTEKLKEKCTSTEKKKKKDDPENETLVIRLIINIQWYLP